MNFAGLDLDRFLRKDANQGSETKDAVYSAVNPAPKRGNDSMRKVGRPKGGEEDNGAPNLLTGTVITSCFIQTSALPSRVEIEGNDITFFDDTYARTGKVIGDTSRIVFTHGSGREGGVVKQGFIWEKRASVHDTYDNVLSLYAMPPKQGKMNYMYFGRDGRGDNAETNYILFVINHSTRPVTQDVANGGFIVSTAIDGVRTDNIHIACVHNDILPPISGEGFSVLLTGSGTGVIAIASDIIPFGAGLDIGSPTSKMGTFYGSVSACPLPTVENALQVLDQIEEPQFVGDRGHYGEDRKYFDDLTFPEELLYTNEKGHTDIEHNHMLGFLLKTVKELKEEVDTLKTQVDSLQK